MQPVIYFPLKWWGYIRCDGATRVYENEEERIKIEAKTGKITSALEEFIEEVVDFDLIAEGTSIEAIGLTDLNELDKFILVDKETTTLQFSKRVE